MFPFLSSSSLSHFVSSVAGHEKVTTARPGAHSALLFCSLTCTCGLWLTVPCVVVCRSAGEQHAPEASWSTELPQESPVGVLGVHTGHHHPRHRCFQWVTPQQPAFLSLAQEVFLSTDPGLWPPVDRCDTQQSDSEWSTTCSTGCWCDNTLHAWTLRLSPWNLKSPTAPSINDDFSQFQLSVHSCWCFSFLLNLHVSGMRALYLHGHGDSLWVFKCRGADDYFITF